MKSEYRRFALTLLFPLVFSACTKRQVTAASVDNYRAAAQGLCLSFVLDKFMKAAEPGSPTQHATILSRDGDQRFRSQMHATAKAISDAKSPTEREKLEKSQITQLMDSLRKESPQLIQDCDRLADGFRKCDKFQSDKGRLRACLEQENRRPMEGILAFLNKDAVAGFGPATSVR